MAASPLTPIGTARIAEPHPGPAVDWVVLGLGVPAVVVSVLALAAWPAWRLARSSPDEAGGDAAARRRSAVGLLVPEALPPAAGVGVRMALQPGRGRTAVPVRSSLAGVVVALAALTGALTFGASLDHLLATPRLYGVTWDVVLSTSGNDPIGPTLPGLAADDRIEAVAVADTGLPLAVDGRRVDALVLRAVKGDLAPVALDGRPPAAADEILLGRKTLAAIHRRIGDHVDVSIAALQPHPARFRIVGTGVLPSTSDVGQLADGAALTSDGESRMIPPDVTPPAPSTAFVRFAPGVDKRDASAAVARQAGPAFYVLSPPKPKDLVDFGRVHNVPLVLAGLLALLAAATLAHTLSTSIRRRRRDLAILKTIGFVPGQVRGAVRWQATTFCAAALAVAVPVGVAVGRWTWGTFIGEVGAVAEPAVPVVAVLVLAPVAVIVANLVAAVPAVAAGRIRPGPVLRAE